MSKQHHWIDSDGVWCSGPGLTAPPGPGVRRPALFLDRDGVLLEDSGYLHDPAGVRILPEAADLLAWPRGRDWAAVIVTNQSGVGRGYFDWQAFALTHARIEALLAERGAKPDLVLACPFSVAGLGHYHVPHHPARKPRPGMLLRAAERLNLDLGRSWIVGDRGGDIEAGKAAGLAGGILLTGGKGAARHQQSSALSRAGESFQVLFAEGPAEARGLLTALAR